MEPCALLSSFKSQPTWLLLLTSLGLLSFLQLSFSLLRWAYVTFLRPGKNLKKYGSWALITGATDGIGKSFAFQFARKGLNLVLVGRNPQKLNEVSASIKSKYPSVCIETVVMDFAVDLAEGVERIKEKIKGLDVGILVNNAGVSYPYARYFHEVDDELLRNLIKVNVEGVTRVTHAVIPGMLERKRGAIVNIGSGAAIVIPSDPLYAVYAATKACQLHYYRLLPPTSSNSAAIIQHNHHHHLDADLMNECRLHDYHYSLIESQGDLHLTGSSFLQSRGNDGDILA